MKLLQRLILAVGAATLGLLLWKMDASAVWRHVVQVGWGLAFILVLEAGAHVFNALGWRFAYRERQARTIGLARLFELRVVGDGVNYLTPSATIAGEFVRAQLLGTELSLHARAAGVVVAKCTQGLAQVLFAIFGVPLFLRGRIPWLAPYEAALAALAALAAAALAGLALYELAARRRAKQSRPEPDPSQGKAAAMARELRDYFDEQPLRCALSVVFFILGFGWGALEAYWICRFLGLTVTASTALAMEVLSVLVDTVFFMVPAKVGTQEGGKTAIFHLFGLPLELGFAFGVIRHLRELVWASLGLGLYLARARRARPGRQAMAGTEPHKLGR